MRSVFSTTERTEAETVRLMLEREEIPVHLRNDLGSFHVTFLPTPATEIEVLVKDEDVEEAGSIVDEYIEKRFEEEKDESLMTEEEEEQITLKWYFLVFLCLSGWLLAPIVDPDWGSWLMFGVSFLFLLYIAYVNFLDQPTEPRT